MPPRGRGRGDVRERLQERLRERGQTPLSPPAHDLYVFAEPVLLTVEQAVRALRHNARNPVAPPAPADWPPQDVQYFENVISALNLQSFCNWAVHHRKSQGGWGEPDIRDITQRFPIVVHEGEPPLPLRNLGAETFP